MKKILIGILSLCLVLSLARFGACDDGVAANSQGIMLWADSNASWSQFAGTQQIHQLSFTKTYEDKKITEVSEYGSVRIDPKTDTTTTISETKTSVDKTHVKDFTKTESNVNVTTMGGTSAMSTNAGASVSLSSSGASSGLSAASSTGQISTSQNVNMNSTMPLPGGGSMSSSFNGSQSASITVKAN